MATLRSLRETVRYLGPGIISGAADLDPTTVATLAIVGSTVGYSLLWLVVLLLPMLVTVQVISARVGLVSRRSLEGIIRDRFGRRLALITVGLVLSVNILTLAADLEGGAAALGLITGLDWRWFILPTTIFITGLLLLGGYYGLQQLLRYLLFVFGAYIIVALLVRPDWDVVLYRMVVPTFSLEPQYMAGAVALLGTTLTSYVYLWETIEMQEERRPLEFLWLMEFDAAVGMVVTTVLSMFIIITTAATLGIHGEVVQTAEDAASALSPIAGPLSSYLFALGLLASAVIAIPIVASTTAYVLADAFDWEIDTGNHEPATRPFYLVLVGSLLSALIIAAIGIEPFRLLFLASLAGGLGTPFLLVLLILISQDPEIMADWRIDRWLQALGWFTVLVIGGASAVFIVQQIIDLIQPNPLPL